MEPSSRFAFLHFDADLFDSTWDVLQTILTAPYKSSLAVGNNCSVIRKTVSSRKCKQKKTFSKVCVKAIAFNNARQRKKHLQKCPLKQAAYISLAAYIIP